MIEAWKRIPGYVRKIPQKLKLGYTAIRAPYFKWVAPGHFYSPLPDMAEVARRSGVIYSSPVPQVSGIDLNASGQGDLLEAFKHYYSELPFERSSNPNSRFFRPNGSFPFQDAFTLYAMIRHLKPAKIVEIGCGSSSCVILDTCEFLKLDTELTFIDPYPELLLGRIRPGDSSRFELKKQMVQDVPHAVFTALKPGDVLFVDTSHASKVGSDVNHIFFEILPLLAEGVVVHFHDIWYPFEYPKEWLLKGMFWNEAYLLRAFLMFNQDYEILMFNSFLSCFQREQIQASFPLFLEEPGASLWLRRK